jgi:Domain of unknown function (DUF4192)
MNAPARPVVLKFGSPVDIVGAIPSLLGFHPAESVVVMCLCGPRRRTGLTMRFDLVDPRLDKAFATEIVRRVAAERADAAIMVCYTEATNGPDRLPRTGLVDEIGVLLLRRGIEVAEALLVRAARWFSYLCSQPCCPPEGIPIPTVAEGVVAQLEAERVFSGRAMLGSREDVETSVRGPVALRRIALEQVYDRVGEAVVAEITGDGAGAFRRRTVAVARSAFDRYIDGNGDLDDAEAARIVLGLRDKIARDELTTWTLDGRIDELIGFLTQLAQRALDEDAAPICTVLASAVYQHGGGALASVALERALRSDPGYEMARLLETMLLGQLPPARLRAVIKDTRSEVRRQLDQSDDALDG